MNKYKKLEHLIRQELIDFGCNKLVTFDNLEKLDRREQRFKLTPHYHLKELLIYFFSVLTRLVLPCKRDIVIYDNFDNKGNDEGLERFYQKVRKGHNLTPHLSKLVFELDQGRLNDPMLSEWGIYHFHIPVNDGKKFFVNRTNQLLFAIVTQTEFVPIDIQPHANETGTYEPWVDVDIFEKLEKHYPQAIQHLKQRAGLQPLTFEQRKALRRKNGNTYVITNSGNEYIPPGFGSVASGHPMQVITKVDQNMWFLEHHLKDTDEIAFDESFNLIARNTL